MVIGENKLIRHVGECNFLLVRLQDLVVEDLMLWHNTLGFHAGEDGATGGEEVVGGAAAHGLNPDGFGVDVDANKLVVVTAA